MVSADDQVVVEVHLSGGECHDAPEGRKSIEAVGKSYEGVPLLMDKAYEGDETRSLARANGHEPIVPPKSNRAAVMVMATDRTGASAEPGTAVRWRSCIAWGARRRSHR